MNLPIFSKLQEGVKFDYETLADSYEETEQFWAWWWEQHAEMDAIDRPETIQDGELILRETAPKSYVDTQSFGESFNDYFLQALDAGYLPRGREISRPHYRTELLKLASCRSTSLDRPQIVFTGGGYGSGKTTILTDLAQQQSLPVNPRHMVGVDYFKFYIPEFSLIQTVADGRASVTVQKECKALSDELYPTLVREQRSFGWDSSMSDSLETKVRIELAKSQGYRLTMIAVLTPINVAIRQAMRRAKFTRRFPNMDALPKSHAGFRKHFLSYVPHFDEVRVFANVPEMSDVPLEIGEKKEGETELAINDEQLLNNLLS